MDVRSDGTEDFSMFRKHARRRGNGRGFAPAGRRRVVTHGGVSSVPALSPVRLQALIRRLVRQLRPYRPEKIILFGSCARGDHHGLSDVDLLVVKRTRKRFLERIDDVMALCDVSMPVEPLVYTPDEIRAAVTEERPFIARALAEGRVIYESP
jgi:predicted nucleotidyltransferase